MEMDWWIIAAIALAAFYVGRCVRDAEKTGELALNVLDDIRAQNSNTNTILINILKVLQDRLP